MKRKIIAIVAGVIALAACHLPTYGGKTEKNDIGCAMRLGTTEYIGWHQDAHWYTCSYMRGSADNCSWTLSLDHRFTVDDRYVVCQYQGHNWTWGSRGFISDEH